MDMVIPGIPRKKYLRIKAHIIKFDKWPDAVKVRCEMCKEWCWIGPRQNRLRIESNVVVHCVLCDPPSGPFAHLGSDVHAIHVSSLS